MAWGPVVSELHVRAGARKVLEEWLHPASVEAGRQALAVLDDLGFAEPAEFPDLVEVQSWTSRVTIDSLLNASIDQLPLCNIAATVADFTRRAQGYDATWSLYVSVASRGQNFDQTVDVNSLYRAGVRTALMQHQSLAGVARSCELVTERYRPLAASSERTLLLGEVEFRVVTDHVLDTAAVPLPTVEPSPADPLVLTTDVAMTAEEVL